jgi:hypothetical protein
LTHQYVIGTSTPPTVSGDEVAVAVALSPTIRHNGLVMAVGDALLLEEKPWGHLGGYGSIAVARIRTHVSSGPASRRVRARG